MFLSDATAGKHLFYLPPAPRTFQAPLPIKLSAAGSSMLVRPPTGITSVPMNSILEQARRDLQGASSAARTAQDNFRTAVAKLRAAEQRVQRLEIAQMETDVLMHELQRRASASR